MIILKHEILAFLGGMFNGDGHLGLSIRHKDNWYVSPSMVYTVNPNDEGLILAIEEHITTLKYSPKFSFTRKKSSPGVITGVNIRVDRRDEVDDFAKSLYPYCYGNKAEQLRLYIEELIPLLGLKSSQRWTSDRFLSIMKVVDKINALKTGERGKYSYEYFLRLFTEEL